MLRAFFSFLIFVAAPAFAADLTTDEVDRFVDTLVAINDLDERYPDVDVELGLDENSFGNPAGMKEAFAKIITPEGKVVLVDSIIAAVNTNPQAAAEFRSAIEANGFENPLAFASVGNRLLLAAARNEMSDEDLAQMQQITSIPAEALPPAFQQVIPFIEAFGVALTNVSQSDIEQARRVQPRLDALDD